MVLKIYWKLRAIFFAIFSKKTLGARALVIKDNEILLVKHTYMSGWYSIGGAIEAHESGLEAIQRELEEEAGITLLAKPSILGFYHNTYEHRDDYVILYLCKEFKKRTVSSNEILEEKWFPLNALPQEISPATKRRIKEYLGEQPISDKW